MRNLDKGMGPAEGKNTLCSKKRELKLKFSIQSKTKNSVGLFHSMRSKESLIANI